MARDWLLVLLPPAKDLSRRATARREARCDVEMSSHLMPELSAHLLAATPTAHWLEYFDWADAILAEPLAIVDGRLTAPAKPGTGLAWNHEAVASYRLA